MMVEEEKPEYDVEEQIEKLLSNLGTSLPTLHNAFLCRDGDFYIDVNVPHHDDEVREIGYIAGMQFSENEDVTSDDIHEFMRRTGIIRGHRFEAIPQYDFDIVFPPSQDQVQTIWNLAQNNPNVDIGYKVGLEEESAERGRGIEGLLKAVMTKFPSTAQYPIIQEALSILMRNHQASLVIQAQNDEGLWIRSFFSDATFNQNNWGVTQEALNRDISSGVKKKYFGKTAPLIDTPDDSHPPDTVEDMIAEQEPYRVGDFVRTGVDPNTKRAYADILVKDPSTIKRIQSGELNYVSPSIKSLEAIHSGGKTLVSKFEINHLALVKKPAYGELKAQIKGRCMGTANECLSVLSNVQAAKVELMQCGGLNIHVSADKVSDSIRQKLKTGEHVTLKMVSDTLEPPPPCKKCGQPMIDHNANSDHLYETGEDSVEQINYMLSTFQRNSENPIIVGKASEPVERYKSMYYHDMFQQALTAADSCVSKWISELSDAHPEWKQDQVIAVAYAKCRRGEKHGETIQYRTKGYEPLEGDVDPTRFEIPVPCVECGKEYNSETDLDDHLKEHIQALKGNTGLNNSMTSTTQDNKISPEEQRRQELENAMKKADEDQKQTKDELDKTKDEVAQLKATLDAEVKKPIAEKIVQAKVKIGTLKASDVQAATDGLMKQDIQYLKTMEADLQAVFQIAEKVKAQGEPTHPRFTYSASLDETNVDKDRASRVAQEIRSRMR